MSEKPVHELFGVPPPARQGRERLLATAVQLFAKKGFQAVGLDEVLADAGVTKTTFYKHFESRDELMLEAVRMRDEWESTAWGREAARLGGEAPAAQLRAYFDVMEQWFLDPEFSGCLFIATTAEFPNPLDPIHRVAAGHKRRTRDAWRDLAAEAGAPDPEGFADQFTALFEGTIVLRHTHGRKDAVAAVRPAVDALFAANGI
ncbi:MAG: TetR/AcrR family transcriptional regulator [Planctomycetota bacterium]